MKKILLLACIIIASISFELFSACPTPMDCPNDTFQGPFYRNIVLTPTCTLRYEYCWRNATCYPGIIYHDLFIGQMQLIGDCGAYQNDILTNFKTYVQYCANDVVTNLDPWDAIGQLPECCPPAQSPCWTDWLWRHGHYACYTDWYWDPVTGYLTIDNCDVLNPRYCWDRVRYCFYMEQQPEGLPRKKFRYESQSYVSQTNCAPYGGPNNDLPCHPVCE